MFKKCTIQEDVTSEREPDAIKFLEENTGRKFLDIGLGSDLSVLTQKAKTINAKINEWDSINLKAQQRKHQNEKKTSGIGDLQTTYLINIQNV